MIKSSSSKSYETLTGIRRVYTQEGDRTKDPLKYKKDAEILEKALVEHPNHQRYQFFLGETYRALGDREKALKSYEKRITMEGGWQEELYLSLLYAAKIRSQLKMDNAIIEESYQKAIQFRPLRAESYYRDLRNFIDTIVNFQKPIQL